MKTCACCGQIVPGPESAVVAERQSVAAAAAFVRADGPAETSPERNLERSSEGRIGRFAVRVDDGLVELCNEAHADAVRRGSAEVEIANVVLRFALSTEHRVCFEQGGVARVAMFDAANKWLSDSSRGGTAGGPQTSADLKMLLARAEEAASLDERSYASAGDFLHVLMTRSTDLATALFVRNVRGYADYKPPLPSQAETRASARVREVQLEMELRRPQGDRQISERTDVGTEARDGARHGRAGRSWETDRPQQSGASRDRTDEGRRAEGPSPRAGDEREFDPRLDREEAGGARPVRVAGNPREAARVRSAIEQGRVAFERERQLPQGSAAAQQALLERLHRQEGQLAELRALMAQMLGQRSGSDNGLDDSGGVNGAGATGRSKGRQSGPGMSGGRGRGRTSALRWARLRSHEDGGSEADRYARGGAGRRSASLREGEQVAALDLGEPQRRSISSGGHGGDGHHGDGSKRERGLRDAREPADPGEGLPPSADNDTEDEGGMGERMKRFYLSPDDDIVRAPSIGPRTAARLTPVGLVLVRDLLNCDPDEVAAKVGARYMPAARIAEWRAQARLVCTIPWLRGTHAQLLVGAGFDTLAKLMRADASAVCAAVLRFAGTREGQSILRSGPAPEIDRIACWIENTAMAEPGRAA